MSRQGSWTPCRSGEGVVTQTFADGTAVVVQVDSAQAHSLDALAAKVWELADGTHSVAAIALAAGATTGRAEATLDQLLDLGLLRDDMVVGHSRRRVLARAAQLGGGLVVAGGVVNSMALPAAAAAVSSVDRTTSILYESFASVYLYGGALEFSSPIYLTDTAVVRSQPATGAYVEINPGTGGAVTLTFTSVTGATASYGYESAGSATNSLTAGTPVTITVAETNSTTAIVSIGT